MRRHYSRLVSTEERKNKRQAVFFGFLTLASILAFIFLGLPVLANFAGFLTDIRKSSLPIEKSDTTPPAPPKLASLPEFTNKLSLKLNGTTEPGASVILSLNGKEEELVADKDGEFSFTFELNQGENTVTAFARDSAGNESQMTNVYKITFDNEEPSLEITSPDDGSEYFGSKERQVTITGKTEDGAAVTINDRIVVVDAKGEFILTTTLTEGENTFTVKTEDRAGNSTQTSLTLLFTP